MTVHGNTDQFADLVGRKFGFYGVDNLCFKLGRKTYEVVENEDDGYRSYLDSVEVSNLGDLIFFRRALASVTVEEFDDGSSEGYRLIDDKDGHEWLRFGTDYYDYYYPCFFFTYQPRKTG